MPKDYSLNKKENWEFIYSIGDFRAESRPFYKNPDLWYVSQMRIMNKKGEVVHFDARHSNSLEYWRIFYKLAGVKKIQYDENSELHYLDKNGDKIPWSYMGVGGRGEVKRI